jgi:ligand-binding sensor domain-containing protein/signal transduction histidine kinase
MNRCKHLKTIAIAGRGFALLLAGVLCSVGVFAQRYPFHNLSVEDGLMQSQATSLAQDKAGNLWIGTLGGLSRYDGRNFTNYTVKNGMPGNEVRAVAVDAAGNIWLAGQAGLSRFDGKKFTYLSKRPLTERSGLSAPQQLQIAGDSTWWRVQGDVYCYAAGKLHRYATPGSPDTVSAMLAEKGGLWVAKDVFIYHQEHSRWDTIGFVYGGEVLRPNVYRIFRDKANQVWATTNFGLFRLDNGLFMPFSTSPDPLLLPPVIAIAQDSAGAIWLGTTSGAIRIAGSNIQYYNKHNGLSDNGFLDLLTDAEGNIWMASDGQGIFRYSGTQFTALDESMGLPSAQVMAIATNNRDSLFLGTYDAGLYIFKDGRVSPLAFPSKPTPTITSLCYTSKSKLWIGTRDRGLWSYQNGIFRQYEAPERNFPSNTITSLYEDTGHRLWIGFNNGAIVVDDETFKPVDVKNAIVQSFLSIGADSVLMATGEKNGLKLYSAGVVTDFITLTMADSSVVQCMYKRGRELWLGSSDNGVLCYNMDTRKAQVYNKAAGLRSDFIYNIIDDVDGNIWVGTGFGIHKIKVAEGKLPQVTFYGKAQGISGMESNMNSVLKQADGSIWFGTTNGAIHYQPHTAVVSSAPHSIALVSVKVTGENALERSWYDSLDNWYGIPYRLRLPYRKNNLSFTFQAISLSGAQQLLYRYRIEGLDVPWSDWSATNSVSYSALPPGNYVFHVQCRGAEDGVNPELSYEFEIITPFQKTNWFRLSVLAACIGMGIGLQYLVNSRKQRRLKLLAKLRAEEQSKIRLRTAEDFHDEIGNKLTRINVLTNVLKNKISLTPEAERILGQIEDNTGQLYSGTRDILWSLKPSNDNLYEILHRIRDFAGELFQDTEVNFTFTGTDEKWRKFRLPMDMSRNLIMIFKEALNNCLKYSKAHNVALDITLKNKNVLQLTLKDDGQGFDLQTIKKGNGLNNMNVRAGRLDGRLYVDSRPGKGTIITLTFKIPPNR